MAEIEPKATPMMAQYLSIKRQQPDCLLFYRMGDFYELFFEDAVEAAAALDITLTKRGQHLGEDIPMCGVPVHSADSYLARLIRKGFRVAVCEQTEDPAEAKKRGAKSVVERAVTRVVTPGTLTEDTLLDARSNNYLAALAKAGRDCAVAWADMSTGSFHVQPVDEGSIPAVIARIAPGELLVPDRLMNEGPMGEILAEWDRIITPLPVARFDSVNAEKRLKELYGVSSLDAYGDFDRAELAAAGTLVDYVELTQVGQLPRLDPISRVAATAIMEIDQATRRNLELVRTLSGERTGSLLSTIDRTVTGPGARLTAVRLSAPLTDPARINARLDHVEAYVTATGLREDIRELLRRTPDIERALSRLSLQRGGPRDLAALRDGLALTAKLKALVSRLGEDLPDEAVHVIEGFGVHDETVDLLTRALAEELPVNARDGGFIAKGFAPELDELKALRDEGRRMIANLEAEYRKLSGVDQLKIKHNNVLGYFIEVSAKNAERMGEPFIHRQTMSNAVRYTTAELGDLARRISEAGDRSLAVEQEIFTDLVSATLERASDIAFAAQALAELDWACGLAELAASADWTRPNVDDSLDFHIEGGRHPVVEAALARQGGEPFVPNDCDLAREERLWLITGPNMAGKSTFLRQNALIAILAQTGSFVPAKEARIGVVDRLFSRVGAADDLARGRSTFMVEMVETATILNQATGRSLVILDEIGRGTATFDGLSIAWACVEHLHETSKSRALFATHYHELTALAERLDALSPHCMRVKEWEGKVVFMHEVAKGSADRSYGIHVARLAGLPKSVVDRAEEVLHTLEKGEQSGAVTRLVDDLPLFQAIRDIPKAGQSTGAAGTAGSSGPARHHPAVEALEALDLDDMTPREALNALYRLKALGKEEG